MAKQTPNPYVLPGALATFVAQTAGGDTTTLTPPTVTATWGTFTAALGVSAPLFLKTAADATKTIRGTGR